MALEPLHRQPFAAAWVPEQPDKGDTVASFAVLLGFLFFLRVSEYCSTSAHGARLTVDGLSIIDTPDGEALQLTIRRSKTDQVGRGSVHIRGATGCSRCPVAAFRRYVATRRHTAASAPALQWRDGRPFTDAHLNDAVKALVSAHGSSPDFFSSHSLRVGGACAAMAAGRSDAWMLREGRWKSIESLHTYIRLASSFGATADMLACADVPSDSRGRKRPRIAGGMA